MAGNIIGEPINPVIITQIDDRQSISGASYNSQSTHRTPEVLNFLNNRNAWIKMASGVSIESAAIGQLKTISKLDNDFLSTKDIENLSGEGLAKGVVLFNTIQTLSNNGTYTSRSGLGNLITDDKRTYGSNISKMYGGLGGTSQGLQPVGGITGIEIENINRGSISKATVSIKVYNRFQFNLLELAYLKLGYIMMLEWGWDKYIDSVGKETGTPTANIKQMGKTIIEKDWFGNSYTQQQMLNKINANRIKHKGNYDAFFGKVSNFNWKANKDGSYDISIDLITLGSVIESLKINLTSGTILDEAVIKNNQKAIADVIDTEANDDGTYDSPMVNNIGDNTLAQFLSLCVINFPESNQDFVYSPALATELISLSYGEIGAISAISGLGTIVGGALALAKYLTSFTGNIPEEDRYYIRLGLFLEQLQKLCVPYVKNGGTKASPSLEMDLNEANNQCNYVTNLVPLDPSICIFTFLLDQEFEDSTYLDVGNFNSNCKPFAVNKDGIVYGQIMNTYMNINFLQKTIAEKVDDKGDLSLFSLLSSICEGINECTGGATNLEPAIKDDRTVYILEQNPIKGKGSGTDTAPIEILGYSPTGQSNFVQDFSFNTKITPDMMSMISIGATAAGLDSREIDAAPWKKWYAGIKNRYEEGYEKKQPIPPSPAALEVGLSTPESIKAAFKSDLLAGNIDYDHITFSPGYDWKWNGVDVDDILPSSGPNLGLSSAETDSKNEALLEEVVRKVHEVEKEQQALVAKTSAELDGKLNITAVVGEDGEVPEGQEYKQYFINAFGGNTGLAKKRSFWPGYKVLDVDRDDSLWWFGKDNSGFINRGKTSFNAYITQLNEKELKEGGVGSSLNGFIPVELGLTVDGISGIKIYNKLEINQRFLPASYPNALKFVIRGVNHKIENNQWSTQLETISTTLNNAKPTTTPAAITNKKAAPKPYVKPITPTTVTGAIPPKNPNEKLLIYDQRTTRGVPVDPRTYKKFQGIDWLVGTMNITVQETWRKFLNALNEKYPGYTLKINATYRTYQRSRELKTPPKGNTSNASPGKSPHNFAYGMDLQIKDPNGKTWRKKERAPWVASGIPALAVSFGMRWGGDFANYVDCVHFDVTRVTSTSTYNAKKANAGKPESQWVTNNLSPYTKLT